MYTRTFVCYPCMYANRSGGRCPSCGESLIPISTKLAIPKKKRKLWDQAFQEWGKVNPYYEGIRQGKKLEDILK